MRTLDYSVFKETVITPVLTNLVATRRTHNVKAVGHFYTPQETVEKRNLRLFVHGTGDYAQLCYYRKGARKRGFEISDLQMDGLFNLTVNFNPKTEMTALDRYCANLSKFKKAFLKDCHPNLWKDIQEGYAKLDIDDFRKYVTENKPKEDSSYGYYELLGKYCKENNIGHLIMENHYKRTTLVSNKEKFDFGGSRIKAIVERLQKAIEKKEDFSEYWHGNYDVHVEVKGGKDGNYRGWFSLEFSGCGNGHYYLLLNSNSAIFCEDD